MKFDEKKLLADLQHLTPEERVKYLESLTKEAKNEISETEKALKQSQEMLDKQRQDMLKKVLQQEKTHLQQQEYQQRLEKEKKKKELSSVLESQGSNLEANVEREARLPATHPIVGLYTQLIGMQQYYQEQQEIDYGRQIVLQEIRKDVVDVLNKYQEVPEEMREIADATYRLVKDLLGQGQSDRTRYEP